MSDVSTVQVGLGFGTLGVAIIVAAITAQQAWINKLRLRHELFERRFEIFKAAQSYLTKIFEEGRLTDETFHEQYPKLVDAWQRSRFLFSGDIPNYLDTIRNRSLKMRTAALQRKIDEEHVELVWLAEQTPVLFDKFLPYMRFKLK